MIRYMKLGIYFAAVLALASCGGSSSSCSPATFTACVATAAHGCDLFQEADGTIVAAAQCTGDYTVTCRPSSTLECVRDCSSYADCAAP